MIEYAFKHQKVDSGKLAANYERKYRSEENRRRGNQEERKIAKEFEKNAPISSVLGCEYKD